MVERRQRVALFAGATVVAGAVLALALLGGFNRPSHPGPRSADPGPTAASPAKRQQQPVSSAPRVLTVEYTIVSRWKDGFNAEMKITNMGSEPVAGWLIRLRLPDGVRVTDAWAADITQHAADLTLRSQPWNTYLGPGAVMRLGFQATGTPGKPTSCSVNGAPC